MVTWMLKPGHEERAKSKHPWIFAVDIQSKIQNIKPGTLVQLVDSKGQFVCAGYGNPQAKIAFRGLNWNSAEIHSDFVIKKVIEAFTFRVRNGLLSSFRACFAEADGLPGLVVDHYMLREKNTKASSLVVQVGTAGMVALGAEDAAFWQQVVSALREELGTKNWNVVLRRDVPFRKAEGLPLTESVVLMQESEINLQRAQVIHPVVDQEVEVDLIHGQKTGFFLDQVGNLKAVCQLVQAKRWEHDTVKILDLFSHTGQWSYCLSVALKQIGKTPHVTLADASKSALAMAAHNIRSLGVEAQCVEMDLLSDWAESVFEKYDIVIVDPPALAKTKQDVPAALHAYAKVNGKALERVRFGGVFVACSCSGVVKEPDFLGALLKASKRAKRSLRILSRASHHLDHFQILEFPEGEYLKCVTAQAH